MQRAVLLCCRPLQIHLAVHEVSVRLSVLMGCKAAYVCLVTVGSMHTLCGKQAAYSCKGVK